MTADQIVLFVLMGGVLLLLLWGRFRYDLVAFGGLCIGAIAGVIPKESIFSEFGHPAVIIIALVLVISRGLQQSGAIEILAGHLIKSGKALWWHIGAMSGTAAILSAFMNNVAALALLMPVDLQAAARANRSPALSLMPLSFASILGGMITLIGTPPNIVIAEFREGVPGLDAPYRMFDFAPVGIACASAGLAYMALLGWRLIPAQRGKHDAPVELANLEGYVIELRVDAKSSAVGKTLGDFVTLADELDVQLLGLVRRGKRLPGYARSQVIRKGDAIVVQAGPEPVAQLAAELKLSYSVSEKHAGALSDNLAMAEAVVPHGARIEGRTAMDVRLLYQHEVMLLGVSRQGRKFRDRVRRLRLQAGDILLLMGGQGNLQDVIGWLGCMPLAGRKLQVIQRDKALVSIGLFSLAVILAATGVLDLAVALGSLVVIYVLLNVMTLQQVYDSVEWPVIVLIASLLPIGAALEASGGTALIADWLIRLTEGWPAVAVLIVLMIVTMTLSDLLNNVATTLVAAPVAIDVANRIGVNPDALLMGVAVAASCAFLTPIGHKNNTIIMGPGGYRFGDYWRVGLGLEILVLAVGIPVILLVWGL